MLQDLPPFETAASSYRHFKWLFELVLIKFETTICFRKIIGKNYKKFWMWTTRSKISPNVNAKEWANARASTAQRAG
jgi:hypothetical protein